MITKILKLAKTEYLLIYENCLSTMYQIQKASNK